MREFKQRRSKRQEISRFALGCLGILILLLVACVAVHGAWDMYQKFATAADSSETATADLATLSAQEEKVSAEVNDLSSSRGVEGQIRERYGVGLPGEGEIEVVRQPASSTPDVASGGGIWSRIFRAIVPW